MGHIATTAEFAYAIGLSAADAAAHALLLDLAEGLVIEELGVRATYPVSAKAVVLAAAARAYYNRAGVRQETVGSVSRTFEAARLGVYLTEDDVDRLHGRAARSPTYSMPGMWPYPDPVERPADPING